jgi:hypothetical protein
LWSTWCNCCRRLFTDPINPEMPFNYDGLLKLVKKIDKELGP